jgi:hypothetical protein
MSFSAWFKSLKLTELVSIVITMLMPAVVTFVWVSLPLLLLQLRINLVFLGVVYSIGILGGLLIRIPLRFYMERGRTDILPVMAFLFGGISLAMFYISRSLASIILAFLVLSISHAMYRAVNGRKQERNLRNTEPMRNFFSQDLVSTVGIFALLILSGLFTGTKIVELYGIISVAALLIGFLGMAYSLSQKGTSNKFSQKTSFRNLVRNAIAPLKSFDMVTNRRVVFPFLAIQILLYLSICIVSIFLPAMAIRDKIDQQDIFFIFAAFAIIGFLLDKVAQHISIQPIKDIFYMFRPIFLIIPFLILSIVISSLLFIVGYFIILLWIFSDSASSDMMLKSMGEGDQIRSRILLTFFSVPISIIGPLLGSLIWMASPRLLYGIAILPAAVSMLLVMLMIDRTPRISAPQTHEQ